MSPLNGSRIAALLALVLLGMGAVLHAPAAAQDGLVVGSARTGAVGFQAPYGAVDFTGISDGDRLTAALSCEIGDSTLAPDWVPSEARISTCVLASRTDELRAPPTSSPGTVARTAGSGDVGLEEIRGCMTGSIHYLAPIEGDRSVGSVELCTTAGVSAPDLPATRLTVTATKILSSDLIVAFECNAAAVGETVEVHIRRCQLLADNGSVLAQAEPHEYGPIAVAAASDGSIHGYPDVMRACAEAVAIGLDGAVLIERSTCSTLEEMLQPL